MIVDERMVTYIRSLERPENPVIEAIEQEALDSFVPIFGDFNERISSGRKPYHNDRKL